VNSPAEVPFTKIAAAIEKAFEGYPRFRREGLAFIHYECLFAHRDSIDVPFANVDFDS